VGGFHGNLHISLTLNLFTPYSIFLQGPLFVEGLWIKEIQKLMQELFFCEDLAAKSGSHHGKLSKFTPLLSSNFNTEIQIHNL